MMLRPFVRKFVGLLLVALPLLGFSETFEAGKDYEILGPEKAALKTKRVSVMEFFSYGCHWCFSIEPGLDTWVKSHEKDIAFKRVPVVFNKEWIYFAKAYYAANLLGKSELLNPLLFKAVQTEKRHLSNNQAMIDFFVGQGIDKSMAESAFLHSTTLDMKVNEGNVIMGRHHINAVPAFIINKTYKTDLQRAKSEARLFKIIDYLLAKSKA